MGQQPVVHCGARRTNRKQGETVNMKEHSFILVCVMVPKRIKGLVQCPVLRIFISNEEFIRKGQGRLAWRREEHCQETIIRLMKKVDLCQVQFQALYMIQQLILFFAATAIFLILKVLVSKKIFLFLSSYILLFTW